MKPDLKFAQTLRKGDVIDTATVASIMGLSPEDLMDVDQLRMSALKLASALERALHKMGRVWTLQAKDGTVRVLTDPEAVNFRKRQNTAGVRKVRRSLTGLLGVDVHHLNAADRSSHSGALNRASAQAAALDAIGRKREPSTMGNPAPAADPARPRPPRAEPAPVAVPVSHAV